MTSNRVDQDLLLGVFIIARHGDRMAYWNNDVDWVSTGTSLSNLGELQSYNLGSLVNTRWLKRTSQSHLPGVNPDLYISDQALLRADMTDGDVTFASAVAAAQAIWPPTKSNNISLADGSHVISPMNGYQYAYVETVDPNTEVFMDGYTFCTRFQDEASKDETTLRYLSMAEKGSGILEQLPPYVGSGRPTTFAHVYDVYDYMSVQETHNVTFFNRTPANLIPEVRGLADWHEWNKYGSADGKSILNIGGATLGNEVLNIVRRLANKQDNLGLVMYTIGYQPFIGLLHLLGVSDAHPELQGIMDYAGAVAFEVRQPSGTLDLNVRFLVKNGTVDDFVEYPMFGKTGTDYDVPLSQFDKQLQPYTIGEQITWCQTCENTIDRGCDVLTKAFANGLGGGVVGASSLAHHLPSAVSGLIGAIIALVLATGIIGALVYFGFLSFGRRARPPSTHHRQSSSIPQIVVRMAKGKRESGDTESTIGIKDNTGFEMMPDLPYPGDAHSTISRAPSVRQPQMKIPE